MMGSGKSAIGRALAEQTGRAFIDTDVLIEQRLGRRISDIFATYSEETFRDHESSVLRGLSSDGAVVSTGGGIVLRPANWIELRRLGTTVFLDVPLHDLVARLRHSRHKRPLLQAADWEARLSAIYEERLPMYRQADVCLSIDRPGVAAASTVVLEALQAHLGSRMP